MMNVKNPVAAYIAAILLIFLFPDPAVLATQKGATAAQLITSADKNVGLLVKLARDSKDPALDVNKDESKPFWNGLKKLNESINKTSRGLQLRDETFRRSIGDAVAAVNETSVAFEISGARDDKVKEAISKVEQAVRLLHDTYMVDNEKRDAALTPQQQAQLDSIIAKKEELEKRLAEVEKNVGKDEKARAGLRKVRRQMDQISNNRSGSRFGDFFAAMFAWRVIDGLIWGSHWWWGPWGGWWGGVWITHIDIYYESIHVVDYDWDYTDIPHDIGDYGLDVAIDEADLGIAEDYLDQAEFPITNEDIGEISEPELFDAMPMPDESIGTDSIPEYDVPEMFDAPDDFSFEPDFDF